MMKAVSAAVLCMALWATPISSAVKKPPKSKIASVYTDLMNPPSCAGERDGDLTCKGLDGWIFDISDTGNVIFVRIGRPAETNTMLELIGRSLGEKAEWRGVKTGKNFRPGALILRMRPSEDDGQISSFIYILKLQGREACVSAVIDAKANAKANELARAAADKLPDSCSSTPRVVGEGGAAAAAFKS
jgi:hypothetical protein